MNLQAKICQICGKVINLSNSGAQDFCQCQKIASNAQVSETSQLDAIPTPGTQQNQVQPAQFNQSNNLKSQLDSIPSPTSDEQTIPPASADSGGLRREVQTNMTSGQSNQAAGILTNELDSIPTPGAPAPQASQVPSQRQGLGSNLKASLDSIPTPGAANPSPQMNQAQAPPRGPAPGQMPPAQPGQMPQAQPSQMPPAQPGQMPPAQPGQMPPAQPGQMPPAQPGQMPPAQPSQMPPAQPGQMPQAQPSQMPPAQPSQMPQAQPSQMPPAQPGQMPQAQPGQMPQAQPIPQPQLVEAPNHASQNPQPDPDDWKSQLDAIPTPKGLDGGGQPAPGLSTPAQAASVNPTMGQAPLPPLGNQSMPLASPAMEPYQNNSTDGFSRSKEFSSVDASQGYTMIFVVVLFVICCVFAYMMMNPSKTADFSQVDSQPQTQTQPQNQSPTP